MLAYLLGITKQAIRELQIGAGFMDYKSGQERLQIGVSWEMRKKDYKSGKRFQIGAKRL